MTRIAGLGFLGTLRRRLYFIEQFYFWAGEKAQGYVIGNHWDESPAGLRSALSKMSKIKREEGLP